MGRHVAAQGLDIWTEQVGRGPDVLLIGGAGDTVESWQFQLDGLADRYRLTAFDNRGAGRTSMPADLPTVEAMADDAAAVLGALGVRSAHVTGFSGGSIIGQELALRHPDRVRTLTLIGPGLSGYEWPRLPGFERRLAAAERDDAHGLALEIARLWAPVSFEDIAPTLAIYTDGLTESFNPAGEEFGEERLIERLQHCRELPSSDLLAGLVNDVRQFSPHEQHDDITLVIARCRGE